MRERTYFIELEAHNDGSIETRVSRLIGALATEPERLFNLPRNKRVRARIVVEHAYDKHEALGRAILGTVGVTRRNYPWGIDYDVEAVGAD
jgi:hypothetical protein